MKNVKKLLGDEISYGENEYSVLKNADALVIATEWALFRTPDFSKIKTLMKKPVVFDGRNLYEINKMEELGFYYDSIGREIVKPAI